MNDGYAGDGFRGMDVPQARKLSGHLRNGAQEVEGMVDSITRMLASVTWSGEDGKRFHQEWTDQFGPQLRGAASTVQDKAAELDRRADAQEAASQG